MIIASIEAENNDISRDEQKQTAHESKLIDTWRVAGGGKRECRQSMRNKRAETNYQTSSAEITRKM
ncbi:hypothetical protein VCRA2119O147_3190001 [Vibrio crassostreae]|nr:hypothetical protein VCRA2119O147_3190001 [Vibrio crassostreae]